MTLRELLVLRGLLHPEHPGTLGPFKIYSGTCDHCGLTQNLIYETSARCIGCEGVLDDTGRGVRPLRESAA
jgi:hypothetical protein